MSELVLGVNRHLPGTAAEDMDAVGYSLQTTDDHSSGGDSNYPCMGFLDQKYVDLAADLIIAKNLPCEYSMDGGSEERPRMGFIDQIDETLLPDFKNGGGKELPGMGFIDQKEKDDTLVPDFNFGVYSRNGDVGWVSRTLSAADEYYKELQELHDSVREHVRSQAAAGKYEALNHELKNGKGIEADYLRYLVRAGCRKMKRAAPSMACAGPPMAGPWLHIIPRKFSKMGDSKDLNQHSIYNRFIIRVAASSKACAIPPVAGAGLPDIAGESSKTGY